MIEDALRALFLRHEKLAPPAGPLSRLLLARARRSGRARGVHRSRTRR